MMTIADAMTLEVTRLSEPQRQQVLEYARSIVPTPAAPRGLRPSDLVTLVGLFPAADLAEIRTAIEDDCEGVDAEAW